jgi:hypothetical protein
MSAAFGKNGRLQMRRGWAGLYDGLLCFRRRTKWKGMGDFSITENMRVARRFPTGSIQSLAKWGIEILCLR